MLYLPQVDEIQDSSYWKNVLGILNLVCFKWPKRYASQESRFKILKNIFITIFFFFSREVCVKSFICIYIYIYVHTLFGLIVCVCVCGSGPACMRAAI